MVDKQLSTKCALKDAGLKLLLNFKLLEYRKIISELGPKLELFTAESLKGFLVSKNEPMNFFKFCGYYILDLETKGKNGPAGTHA